MHFFQGLLPGAYPVAGIHIPCPYPSIYHQTNGTMISNPFVKPHPEELFENYSESSIRFKLWAMHKAFIVYAAQQPLSDEEVENHMDFLEMLTAYVTAGVASHHKRLHQRPTEDVGKALCDALVLLLDPDALFLDKGEEITDLYVLLPHHSPNEHAEIEQVVGLISHHQPAFRIHSIHSGFLAKSVQEGNLYFLIKVLGNAPAFVKPGFEGLPDVDDEHARTAAKHALDRLETGLSRAEEFYRLAAFAEPDAKIFLLHQTAELALRAVLMAWEKVEKKTHEIRILIRFCSKYIPALRSLFHADGDSELLALLDQAYCKSRYQPNFQLTPEVLEGIRGKVEELLSLCHKEREKFH